MTPKDAPQYGRRLIPQIQQNLALSDPNRIVYSITTFSENKLKFRHINAHEFAKAIDKTAWWLQTNLSGMTQVSSDSLGINMKGEQLKAAPKIRVLGYIGPRTLRTFDQTLAKHHVTS